jgi:uncharacterized protein Yka (UPF0111/DUF47 family)
MNKVLVDVNTVNEAMMAIRALNDDEYEFVYNALEKALATESEADS